MSIVKFQAVALARQNLLRPPASCCFTLCCVSSKSVLQSVLQARVGAEPLSRSLLVFLLLVYSL
jgi:hypothetical protein